MTFEIGIALMIVASLLTAIGQIFFKKAAILESSLIQKFRHPIFLLGGGLFICAPFVSSLAAKVLDFSIMYAMTALNFVFILPLSVWILNEKIDWPKILGVILIISGLLIMVFPFDLYDVLCLLNLIYYPFHNEMLAIKVI